MTPPIRATLSERKPETELANGAALSGAQWSAADRAAFAGGIRAIVNDGTFPVSTGVVFLDPRSGRPLYEHGPDIPLVPASTMKLVVAAAALRTLGSAHRFTTRLVATGPLRGGVIEGDVYPVGSGDPELSSHDLNEAALALTRAGVRLISGGVYADGSEFGADGVSSTWSSEDLIYGWAAPASAVCIDNGAIQFTVTPAASGQPASVDVQPPGAIDRLDGSIATVAFGADTELRIDPAPTDGTYLLSGQIPEGVPQKFWRSLSHPTPRAAIILTTILRRHGIAVAGPTGVATAPRAAQLLWTHRSRPLTAIVKKMWFDSDNHYAEQLLRAVGYATRGLGTPKNGFAAERDVLDRMAADPPGVRLADGSGLSPDNRVTALMLGSVLRSLALGTNGEQIISLLPRVGIDGTVRAHPIGAAATGRVYGKSGYIEGVSGLAGYIKTAHHGLLIYVFLVNDWTTSLDAVWAAEGRMLDEASRW